MPGCKPHYLAGIGESEKISLFQAWLNGLVPMRYTKGHIKERGDAEHAYAKILNWWRFPNALAPRFSICKDLQILDYFEPALQSLPYLDGAGAANGGISGPDPKDDQA